MDRGASLWDCPEYILTAWRLEVGHPPGNPTWQLVANVVAHLGGSPARAAVIINGMSAVAMALASTFLSGIIWLLLRGSLLCGGGKVRRLWANVCAGSGALCYAWCDSAIFSSVEAEVYALSAMFTALMLLLALQWARLRRRGRIAESRRVMICMAYVAGLGVGVHELNFLILPAVVLIFWYGAGWRIVRRDSFPTLGWCLALFMVGTTTYLLIPIRAAANPPINEGDPSTPEAFRDYYARTQYGSRPFLYGPTPYSVPLLREDIDSTGRHSYTKYYLREKEDGSRENVYPEELKMWLPRMQSSDSADIAFYEAWAGMTPENMVRVEVKEAVDSLGRQVGRFNETTGKRETTTYLKPTYLQQLRYLGAYQLGYMYFRYLLWNYGGRQNNLPSTGAPETGNFITGIEPIDNAMLGTPTPQERRAQERNKGYNRYFMIPFLFGIAGIVALIASGRRGRRVCAITALFFLFTGVLIAFYLNQNPGEPRERDYSFLGSYMAYAIWIGCGMAAIVKAILRIRVSKPAARRALQGVAALICIGVPLQMLSQTYDDHDRSHSPGAEAVASRLFALAEPDAIIFAYGDNTIFPLWYAQEVLGERRDVTVVAIPYLAAGWYRGQLRRPGEESLPVKVGDTIPAGAGKITDRVMEEIIRLNRKERPLYRTSPKEGLIRVDTIAAAD